MARLSHIVVASGALLVAAAVLTGCSGRTTGATKVAAGSAQLNALGSCETSCTAFMRWRRVGASAWTEGPRVTVPNPVTTTSWHQTAPDLAPETRYEYQACGKEAAYRGFVCVGPSGPSSVETFTTAPRIPPVQSASDAGLLRSPPVILGRDAAYSAPLDGLGSTGTSVWVFGDTIMSSPGADCDNLAVNTMSFSGREDASNGLTVGFSFADSTGAPTEFLPLTADERAYNATHKGDFCHQQPSSCSRRVAGACNAEFALWPGSVVADPAGRRLLYFFLKIWRGAGQVRTIGSGIAVSTSATGQPGRVPSGSALRDTTLLFGEGSAPDDPSPTSTPDYRGPVYIDGAVLDGPHVYAYDCNAGCKVARAARAQATDRAAWEFYNATAGMWSADPSAATALFSGGAGGMTVSYNPYLRKFLALYQNFASQRLAYRVSSSPQGPWSDEGTVPFSQPPAASFGNYAGHGHDEFSQAGGRIVFLTYAHPSGGFGGEIRIVKVAFG